MSLRATVISILLAALLLLCASASCTPAPSSHDGKPSTASGSPAPTSEPTSKGDASSSELAQVGQDAAAAIPPVTPRGTLTLVVQRVSSRCFSLPDGKRSDSFLGNDLLLERTDDAATDEKHAKPTKEFVFCPKETPDGGTAKVRLNTWEMCSSYPKCEVVNADASADRVEVTCGKEHVVLQSDGHRTWITGSFGEREIAPYPMTLAPPKRAVRIANVDC